MAATCLLLVLGSYEEGGYVSPRELWLNASQIAGCAQGVSWYCFLCSWCCANLTACLAGPCSSLSGSRFWLGLVCHEAGCSAAPIETHRYNRLKKHWSHGILLLHAHELENSNLPGASFPRIYLDSESSCLPPPISPWASFALWFLH